MDKLYVKALSISELPLLLKLFKYKDAEAMIKENTENIESGAIEIFGLFKNGRLIGELHVKYKSEDEQEAVLGRRAYLFAFRVQKKYRSKGCGKHLLEGVISNLSGKGYTEFTVGVEDDNERAIHIYKNFGFHEMIARKWEEYQGDCYEYNLYLKCL